MTKPADKWTQKAREIVLSLWPDMDPRSQKTLNDTPIVIAIARALEATDKAATERVGEMLKDPAFVNVNIMRGGIVLPSNYVRTTDTDGPYKAALEAEYQRGKMEERERCALIAEGSFAFDIDVWLNATKKEMTAKIASAIAAAIRKGEHNGQ